MNYTATEELRYQELCEEALDNFISSSNYNPIDYLDEDEAEEFEQLADKIFS